MSDSTSQKIAIGLRQVISDMRNQAEARMEDTSVEAKGFLSEAMDQYADRIAGYAAELESEVASGAGVAGTHAYDMLSVAAAREVETTEMLIHMVAGTVLMKRLEFQAPVVTSMEASFSPADMDAMHRDYDLTATRDGMLTVVRIERRKTPNLSLMQSPGIDETEPALPQAPLHEYNRPHWFAMIGGQRTAAADRAEAEAIVRKSLMDDDTIVAEIENRNCPYLGCGNSATAKPPCALCYE